MKKAIYVSRKARAFLQPFTCDESVICDFDDPARELGDAIDSHGDEPLFLVIFLHLDEYDDAVHFLKLITRYDALFQMVVFGPAEGFSRIPAPQLYWIAEFRSAPLSAAEATFIARKAFALLDVYCQGMYNRDEYLIKLLDTRQDMEDLINIGRALSSEKDPDNLLRLILILSKKITGADAGSIYLVEVGEDGVRRLRFKYSHTFSADVPLEEFVIDINKHSIAGFVAATGEVLNIRDAYNLPPDTVFSYNSSFDKANNYQCRSMLVVPMRNYANEIMGVMQLINCKEQLEVSRRTDNEAFTIKLERPEDFVERVIPFNEKYDNLLEAIAGQAAIAIENNRLITQIRMQFEEFVKASVIAIESRDPGTSGHSFRVAELCKAMAVALRDDPSGPFAEVDFSDNAIRELELAALLHDFGKVYIDLSIFKKAKKLFPADFDNLNLRLDFLYRSIELRYAREESERLRECLLMGRRDLDAIVKLEEERNRELALVRDIKEKIAILNEPSVTDHRPEEVLPEIQRCIRELNCCDLEGNRVEIITERDSMSLSVPRGSLNPAERREIESHVMHTYNFVSKIPWPPEFRNIPEIALGHHEKIDGSGYPRGLSGRDSMAIQSRIMAIADIYDALSAADRPYKKAVPLDKVLRILAEEAEKNKIDRDLVDIFIQKKIYEKVDRNSFRNN